MAMTDWGTQLMARLATLGTDKRLPVAVMLLLIALLAQSMAQMTWKLLPTPPQAVVEIPGSRAASGQPSGTSRAADVARVAQWHLFGDVVKVAPKAATQVTEAPDTRLNLKLHGVLASSDPAAARAIIVDGKGVEESYAVGQTVPGDAILREIYADRVILEYRGRLETLRLPKDVLDDAVVSSNSTPRQSNRAVNQASTADNTALLRQYRDALTNNPQSLMDLVSATPVTEKGTGMLKGYRIRPGKDRKLLGRFGLKSGDVVTSVNGVPLNNPIKALEIMRDLSTATSVMLDVERNGVTQSFAFQVE